MIKNIFLILVFPFVLINCKPVEKLDGEKSILGAIQTCVTDSSFFLNSSEITIKYKRIEHNSDCVNRPKFSSKYYDWPSSIWLNFENHSFFLNTGKNYIITPKTNLIDKVEYKPKSGKLKFNNKTKILKLSLEQYNWEKIYKVDFNKVDSVIRLSEIKK